MRIASFLPAGTTICFELGLGDEVACVSFECKFPPAAKDKPKVIRCIFNSDDLTSAEIECAVTTNLAASVPLYEIDESLLKDVDVVLIQDLCEVCAIGPPMVLAVLEKLQVQPRVVYLTARTLEGLYKDVMSVATACDVEERGIAMVESMRARVNRVERALVDCTPVKTIPSITLAIGCQTSSIAPVGTTLSPRQNRFRSRSTGRTLQRRGLKCS
ncbi:hypothetical protein, variant 2 [Aphanomyces invadans]|uniref:Fe/B12 periplasmic-binding domain-containing protein n=1 Tax=Aphanomyces invadans TaxID=157072 RepID=A0A024U9Y4_9STRA|nr:hypothetical protein, variant 2 [Aphanomyces invadans]ETW03231.1 hypothetical protein, variant 2 [Aphanomyces invadans]|eukprot:XP_008868615.1 hypothetical protein, variant 2 [Aphanomyces invadans]